MSDHHHHRPLSPALSRAPLSEPGRPPLDHILLSSCFVMDDHAFFRLLAFPVELLDLIFQELDLDQLPPLLRVSSFIHNIASRVLYRIIPELPIQRSITCLKSLSATPANALLVRRLSIDWSQHRVVSNLFRLLRDTLTHLANLRHLSIELSPQDNHYSLAWVLRGVRAPLRTLGTSIRCDAQLAEVLDEQRDLTELCLRGFPTKQSFLVADDAMPRLRSFRAVHAGPSVIAAVVRGRPVEAVSLSMFTEDGCEPLDALVQSAAPVKRLTIMSLDRTLAPNVLLPEIARRLPSLEALHVVVLMALFDTVSSSFLTYRRLRPSSLRSLCHGASWICRPSVFRGHAPRDTIPILIIAGEYSRRIHHASSLVSSAPARSPARTLAGACRLLRRIPASVSLS